jgi:hypothetical protein
MRTGTATFAIGAGVLIAGLIWNTPGRLAQPIPSVSGTQKPVAEVALTASLSPYIDTHAHFDPAVLVHPDIEVEAALLAMDRQNAAKLIFLPAPYLPDDPKRFDHEAFMAAVKQHPARLAFEGGGGSLNPMIQESVRTAVSGPEVQRKFKQRAEQILRDGAVGFGEMTAEHLAFLPGQAYEYVPPDHPLFLLLADIAAEHGVPIDLHSEAVPQPMPLPPDLKSPPNPPKLRENIAALERLLAHNPRAKILWAHAGSDFTGYRTPDLCRRLLQAHANLYMEIKIDPLNLGKNPPLENGKIKPEWLKLFTDFPDRFVIGTDQHYASDRAMTGPQRSTTTIGLLNQLPAELRRKLAMENSVRIFSLSKPR